MIRRVTKSAEWQFFGALFQADRALTVTWWSGIVARGVLPAAFAIAMGVLVGAVQKGSSLTGPLIAVGVIFVLLQVSAPLHNEAGRALGRKTAGYLHDRLMRASVRPPGMGHLEDPLATDQMAMARDFELGITGPPLHICIEFVTAGFVEIAAGIAQALVLTQYHWWAGVLIAIAWGSTHILLRESAVWRAREEPEIMNEQRHADYAYRLAVDSAPSKEVRLFGLSGWVVDRFAARRRRLVDMSWTAMRMRQKSVLWCLIIIIGANVLVFGSLARDASGGNLTLAQLIVFAQTAVGASALAFGGFDWALRSAAQPVPIIKALEASMGLKGELSSSGLTAAGTPAHEIRLKDLHFAYGPESRSVLDGVDLTIPAGSSIAIVGQNGAGKTTLVKLLCRLYDPTSGSIEVDGTDIREFDIVAWRQRVTAVFQDFIRFEFSLRDNVAPVGAPDEVVRASLALAGAANLADLDTILSRAYAGGTDLSGGQWQRIALARALCAVRMGAGVVILDEPTAQLDVRGEAEIFDRILNATRDCTTILISHRFSTVRHADRICVIEDGKVIELGSHDELIALGGRYRTMFDLQASRFGEKEDEEESLDELPV